VVWAGVLDAPIREASLIHTAALDPSLAPQHK
jgi:hypothetical protein